MSPADGFAIARVRRVHPEYGGSRGGITRILEGDFACLEGVRAVLADGEVAFALDVHGACGGNERTAFLVEVVAVPAGAYGNVRGDDFLGHPVRHRIQESFAQALVHGFRERVGAALHKVVFGLALDAPDGVLAALLIDALVREFLGFAIGISGLGIGAPDRDACEGRLAVEGIVQRGMRWVLALELPLRDKDRRESLVFGRLAVIAEKEPRSRSIRPVRGLVGLVDEQVPRARAADEVPERFGGRGAAHRGPEIDGAHERAGHDGALVRRIQRGEQANGRVGRLAVFVVEVRAVPADDSSLADAEHDEAFLAPVGEGERRVRRKEPQQVAEVFRVLHERHAYRLRELHEYGRVADGLEDLRDAEGFRFFLQLFERAFFVGTQVNAVDDEERPLDAYAEKGGIVLGGAENLESQGMDRRYRVYARSGFGNAPRRYRHAENAGRLVRRL